VEQTTLAEAETNADMPKPRHTRSGKKKHGEKAGADATATPVAKPNESSDKTEPEKPAKKGWWNRLVS